MSGDGGPIVRRGAQPANFAIIHKSTALFFRPPFYSDMALLKRADLGNFLDLVHGGPAPLLVLFFVAPSVDAICTLKILTVLFLLLIFA